MIISTIINLVKPNKPTIGRCWGRVKCARRIQMKFEIKGSIIITINLSNFMYNQRHNIDLESILDKGSALSRPRAPTPIRKVPVRVAGNKENMINPTNQWAMGPLKINTNFDDKQLLLPENNSKKPLISPVRNQFKTQIDILHEQQKRNNKGMFNMGKQRQSVGVAPNCANHPNKNAEFNIDIEDECIAYCSRCAAQLASQGFSVRKIQAQTVKKGMPNQSKNLERQLPIYPEYQGNPMYELILQFLTDLSEVEHEHLQNMTKLSTIDEHYIQQIEQTKYFYSEILSFVEQMRDDHINDLVEESRRHSQIADIEHDYLRENVDEISNIRKDIEENLETIVEKLDEEDLKNNLNYYKQKLQVYRHKVQEQTDFFNKLISFTPDQYQNKQARVEEFLMEVWNTSGDISQSQQSEQPQRQSQQRFVQKFTPTMPVMQPQSQNRPSIGPPRELQNLLKLPQNQNQSQFQYPQSARLLHQQQQQQPLPVTMPNATKKQSNQTQQAQQAQQEAQNKSTAFRKLFEEDEDQVMAETSPQFKKI